MIERLIVTYTHVATSAIGQLAVAILLDWASDRTRDERRGWAAAALVGLYPRLACHGGSAPRADQHVA